jgi:hypothetical protein
MVIKMFSKNLNHYCDICGVEAVYKIKGLYSCINHDKSIYELLKINEYFDRYQNTTYLGHLKWLSRMMM